MAYPTLFENFLLRRFIIAASKHTLKNKHLLKAIDTLSFGSFVCRWQDTTTKTGTGLPPWNPTLNKDLIAL
ncbi:MAG: hypothetical protein R3240_06835 [Gammaproteobacteria bacterium]|nr:hypothetical protein [Gammaproteobacteria bacterium]